MPSTVSLNVLSNLRVASPCTASWDDMTGDDRRRLCGQCNLHVHNLSAMTADEAAAFVLEATDGGRRCVRFHQRADGTVLTKDCPVGWRLARQRLLGVAQRATAAVMVLLGFGGIVSAGSRNAGADLSQLRPYRFMSQLLNGSPPVPTRVIMGDMCIRPPLVPSAPVTPGGGPATQDASGAAAEQAKGGY